MKGEARPAQERGQVQGETGRGAGPGTSVARKESPAQDLDRLIALALAQARLFVDQDGLAWAVVRFGQERRVVPVLDATFRTWLQLVFKTAHGRWPSLAALDRVIPIIADIARQNRLTCYVRVAPDGTGGIWLDLADGTGEAIHITPHGHRIVGGGPLFRQGALQAPLPRPEPGGSLERLWEFIPVVQDQRPLVLAWLLQALWPSGPYAHLFTQGPQGSGKTLAARVLKSLIDPEPGEGVLGPPRSEEDLAVCALHSHVLVFDNLTRLPDWLSDALCRLSTGGGLRLRRLYTNTEAITLSARRPCIVTSIGHLIRRDDLADRSFIVELEPPARRLSESEVWARFLRERPRLLGALLERLSHALMGLSGLPVPPEFRLVHVAQMAIAAELALREADSPESAPFAQAFRAQRNESADGVLDASPVAQALRKWLTIRPLWLGTASALLDVLKQVADRQTLRHPDWPLVPQQLSAALRALAPALARQGILVEFRRTGSARLIRIARDDGDGGVTMASSPLEPLPDWPGEPSDDGDDAIS